MYGKRQRQRQRQGRAACGVSRWKKEFVVQLCWEPAARGMGVTDRRRKNTEVTSERWREKITIEWKIENREIETEVALLDEVP